MCNDIIVMTYFMNISFWQNMSFILTIIFESKINYSRCFSDVLLLITIMLSSFYELFYVPYASYSYIWVARKAWLSENTDFMEKNGSFYITVMS